ncbi:hypothetical protein BU15DRAFT_69660 [Melanogaster broomeanus]|nr:hypothetical protein BU15DRAFT_69660 [Melanogaster broomeanus]
MQHHHSCLFDPAYAGLEDSKGQGARASTNPPECSSENRVNGRLVSKEGLCLPYNPIAQEVRVPLDWDGFNLVMERRVACYTCGKEEHSTFNCSLKQKLLVEEKGWACAHIKEVEEPNAVGQENIPVQGSSTAKADTVGQTGGDAKKRKRSC